MNYQVLMSMFCRKNHYRRPVFDVLEGREMLSNLITVNTLADDPGGSVAGQTTFRDAIALADQSGAAGNVINFAVAGTIVVQKDLPEITASNLVIAGPGANNLTIGGNAYVGEVPPGGLVVDHGSNTTIEGVGVSGFWSTPTGSALVNHGTVTLVNDSFTNNITGAYLDSPPHIDGAALWNDGTALVVNTTFANNISTENGGAIENSGMLVVMDSLFVYNGAQQQGGAIDSSGDLILIDSAFTDNNSNVSGTAIESRGLAILVGNTFSKDGVDNSATAIDSTGELIQL